MPILSHVNISEQKSETSSVAVSFNLDKSYKLRMNILSIDFIKHNKRIINNALFMVVLNVLQRGLSLVTIYILVRSLSLQDFGHYQFVFSVVGMVTVFSLPGMHAAIIQSVARGNKGLFFKAIKPSLMASTLGSLILTAIAFWFYFTEENHYLFFAFLAVSVLFPISRGLQQWRSVDKGHEHFSTLLIKDGILAVTTVSAIALISYFFPGNLLWPLLAVFCLICIQNIGQTYKAWKSLDRNSPTEDGSIEYGVKATLYSSFNIIAQHIDKVLIYAFLSPISLALFFAAERFADLCNLFVTQISQVIIPKFSKTEKYNKRLNKILIFISIFIGGGFIVFSLTLMPMLIKFLFGDKFTDAIPYAQILISGVALSTLTTLQESFLYSKLDKKNLRDYTVNIALIRIISSCILIPFYGIWGAIISSFIYRFTAIACMNFILKKRY